MRGKNQRHRQNRLQLEQLESRQLLASVIFPAYVDGVFTLGTANTATGTTPYGAENTFLLESNPTATKTIYLDFDGHHSVNNSWDHDIEFPAFNTSGSPTTFSNTELVEIQQQFQNIAEDFFPFDVNVTTKDPGTAALIKSNSADQFYGVRMVATQATSGFGNGIGGVAFLNSFDDNRDNPVFAFNKGARNGGMTASHEVGHALGLSHDGLNSQSYHPGTGSGQTGWGPIMGAPFGKALTQWSNGDYAGATTTQNDLNIITKTANGFGFKADDYGNNIGSAHALAADVSGTIFEWGIIERNTDLDYFSFETEAGSVSINLKPLKQDPNLDIEAKLYDSTGTEIATSNDLLLTEASFSLTLDAGTYYLSIDGVGRPDRYSDYGSLGFYSIDATVATISAIDGDFNDDGLWDTVDIDMLVADIVGGGTPGSFDLSGDGFVDIADVDAWCAEAGAINLTSGNPYLVGDANLDGFVDGSDFVAWNNNKFTTVAAWTAADFNADGTVDGQDFTLWNANKFMSADSAGRSELFAADIDEEAPFWPFEVHHEDHEVEHDVRFDAQHVDLGGSVVAEQTRSAQLELRQNLEPVTANKVVANGQLSAYRIHNFASRAARSVQRLTPGAFDMDATDAYFAKLN